MVRLTKWKCGRKIANHFPSCSLLHYVGEKWPLTQSIFWWWHFVCLCPARAYSGNSVWQPAEAAPQPHRFHSVAAAGSGESLPTDPVPRCWHEREAGFLHQPSWSSYTGERTLLMTLDCKPAETNTACLSLFIYLWLTFSWKAWIKPCCIHLLILI